MCKVNIKNGDKRMDPCMRPLIKFLNGKGFNTIASCCGHGKYPMTIIIGSKQHLPIEVLSGISINRTRRFYKRDKKGVYFIPEVVKK